MSYSLHSSCGSSLLPTNRGDVQVKRDHQQIRVDFPVVDTYAIKQMCEAQPSPTTLSFPGGCENFVRNDQTYSFVKDSMPWMGVPNSSRMVEQLGMCFAPNMEDYLKWRDQQSPQDHEYIKWISSICNH